MDDSKKKILIIVLIIISFFTVLGVKTYALDCEHEWDEDSYYFDEENMLIYATCSNCGQEYSMSLDGAVNLAVYKEQWPLKDFGNNYNQINKDWKPTIIQVDEDDYKIIITNKAMTVNSLYTISHSTNAYYICRNSSYDKNDTWTLEEVYDILYGDERTVYTFNEQRVNIKQEEYIKVLASDFTMAANGGSSEWGKDILSIPDLKDYIEQSQKPDEPTGEFMKGDYYVILSQESIIENLHSRPEITTEAYGYVDTVDYVEIPSKVITKQDGDDTRTYRGLLYVVISSDTKGDLIGYKSIAENNSIWDWFIGHMTRFGIWSNLTDMQRNNYKNLDALIFYNSKGTLNRYYFNTIQDAAKFVLYGTSGAEPLYVEEGKTDYGYGYISCEYNNYDITGYNKKVIPMEQYPMGRQTIILAQHDVQGPGRKFVYIDTNYYSRVSLIDKYYNLIINNAYMEPEYYSLLQTEQDFNVKDISLYKEDVSYKVGRTATFPLYNKETTDDTGTWDVIYSTYSIYVAKEGYILDGDEKPPIIQVWKDDDGNLVVENTGSGQAFMNGDTDPYEQDENGVWKDKDGNIWHKEDYNNEILEWQETIKKYQNSIEDLAELIEDFTGFINDSEKDVGEITDLLNAVMMSFPSIFRVLIMMSFIALVISRIVRRRG